MTAGKLVVCGTPCGNLEDASPRLARALAAADLIACGDPARTRELLARLGVQASTAGLHQVGEGEPAERLADRVAAGALVALVADAGAPGASDPGRHLVAACLARGLVVELVPGPSAVPPALLVSGLPSDRFCCEGWLPDRAGARDRRDPGAARPAALGRVALCLARTGASRPRRSRNSWYVPWKSSRLRSLTVRIRVASRSSR